MNQRCGSRLRVQSNPHHLANIPPLSSDSILASPVPLLAACATTRVKAIYSSTFVTRMAKIRMSRSTCHRRSEASEGRHTSAHIPHAQVDMDIEQISSATWYDITESGRYPFASHRPRTTAAHGHGNDRTTSLVISLSPMASDWSCRQCGSTTNQHARPLAVCNNCLDTMLPTPMPEQCYYSASTRKCSCLGPDVEHSESGRVTVYHAPQHGGIEFYGSIAAYRMYNKKA